MGDVENGAKVTDGPRAGSESSTSSLAKFVRHDGDIVFSFTGCRYYVPVRGGEKMILKGISGSVRSGEVLAIMGPSGSGKTSLMNLLTLEPGPGRYEGSVTINGEPVTMATFRDHVSVRTHVAAHRAIHFSMRRDV